jgi:hypothetical protein
MASTYEKIATNTLGSTASSVTFSSISSAYTDLVLIAVPAITTGSNDNRISTNLSGTYSNTYLYGTGTTASSGRTGGGTYIYGDWYASVNTTLGATVYTYQFMNYANTTTYKTILGRANSASSGVDAIVGLIANTAAINSITLTIGASTYAIGSTFTLYGIKAA